jgi:amidohydrolase
MTGTKLMSSFNFLPEAQSLQDEMVVLRRDLHAHPELGFQERRTARLVAEHLHAAGLEVREGLADTGVLGRLEGAQAGRTVWLRFDMDALPVTEETGAPYASQNPGVMHACAHDGHVAIGLTLARLLARHRGDLHGRVVFAFQPAEEGQGGAERMIADGALEPRPDLALVLHLWNPLPLGQAAISPGPVMAAADLVRITVRGKGGHGAFPHQTVDPIVAAAQIVTALQTVVSRNVDPLATAVLTMGTIHGGTAFNVIADEVELTGTVRTFAATVREQILQRLVAIAQGTAAALGATAEVAIKPISPAVVNNPAATRLVHEAAAAILGEAHVLDAYQTMGAEDAALFLQAVPGCYFFLGSANPERGLAAPHHSPRFDFDEAALPLGVAILAETVARYLA